MKNKLDLNCTDGIFGQMKRTRIVKKFEPIKDQEELIEDEEELSYCCGAKIIYHDICSLCREHV